MNTKLHPKLQTPHVATRVAARWAAAICACIFFAACSTTTPDVVIDPEDSTDDLSTSEPLDDIDEDVEAVRAKISPKPKEPKKATKKDGWSKVARPSLGLSFKIPSHWETASKGDLFFANPKPPGDDTVVIFMRVGSQDAVGDALTKLDQTFPMEKVRYTDQQKEEKINGMRTTFGEGVGFSKDFKTDLHFFIMLIDTKSDDYTLMAVYIKEDVFEARKPMVSEIIMSMNPIEAS